MPVARLTIAAVLLLPSITLAAAAEGDEKAGSGSLFEAPGFATLATSVITLLIFLGLLAVLAKFAWGPIVKSLDERESRIRGDIEAAEAARAEAEKSRADYQAEMATAEQRVRDLMAQAQADGQQLATRIKMQAQEDAEEIKERANREIEQTRLDAVEQVRREAAELAVAVAEKILRRDITSDDQQRLVDASLDELERSDLKSQNVTA
jgi:F-type H+-transporting ATPase subunit b